MDRFVIQVTHQHLRPVAVQLVNMPQGHRANLRIVVVEGVPRFEYRYLLGALSRVFLFFDAGYIFSRREEQGEIVRDELVRTGYGEGLRGKLSAS